MIMVFNLKFNFLFITHWVIIRFDIDGGSKARVEIHQNVSKGTNILKLTNIK